MKTPAPEPGWGEDIETEGKHAKTLRNAPLKLRILATTDLHMQVLAYNYQAGQANDGHGFAYTATLIRQAQQEVENTLLVDNGDLLCGISGEPSILKNSTSIHPIISIMNDLGYDAATAGNHDFDYGLSYFLQATMQADFPFVSANTLINVADNTAHDQTLFSQYTILERQVVDADGVQHTLRIGVTGFLPPGSISQFESNEYVIKTPDIIEAATKIIPQIKAAGADIVIVLAHTGIGNAKSVLNMENAAVPLAKIDGIDAIVFGHRHQLFPGPGWNDRPEIDTANGTIHDMPMVAPGAMGSHLGIIDLELEHNTSGWVVTGHTCSNRAIFETGENAQGSCGERLESVPHNIAPDATALRCIASTHEQMLDWTSRPVGQISQQLHSFFAIAAPCHAVQTIQHAALWFVSTHFPTLYDESLPLLASACAFKSGGYGGPLNFTNIEAGEITKRGLTDLYPFHNHIGLLEMRGALLREWLERSASIFTTRIPGSAGQPLKAPDIGGYLYETVLGLDYSIDLTQAARYDQQGNVINPNSHRITNLSYLGKPLNPMQSFMLITNNYRQGGGGFYPPTCLQTRIKVPEIAMQCVLAAYFQAHPNHEIELDPHWRFTPIENARFTFRSSPKAAEHLQELAPNTISPLGFDKTGYQLFELIL